MFVTARTPLHHDCSIYALRRTGTKLRATVPPIAKHLLLDTRQSGLSLPGRQGDNVWVWLVAVFLICLTSPTTFGEDGSVWPPSGFLDSRSAGEQPIVTQAGHENVQTPFANGELYRGCSSENWQSPRTTEPPQSFFGGTGQGPRLQTESINQTVTSPESARGSDFSRQSQHSGVTGPAGGAIPLRHAGDKETRQSLQAASSPALGSRTAPWVSTLSGLAIVLGTLFLFYWGMKRLGPKTNQIVPSEAVEMLGYAPLSGRQKLCLIRVGRKLILIAVSSDAVEPLTEIEDPVEVDRLVGLCASQRQGSATQVFQQVLSQYVAGTATGG
ncbi:MAG: FliO/MopB family protein [Thermogutta sp.]